MFLRAKVNQYSERVTVLERENAVLRELLRERQPSLLKLAPWGGSRMDGLCDMSTDHEQISANGNDCTDLRLQSFRQSNRFGTAARPVRVRDLVSSRFARSQSTGDQRRGAVKPLETKCLNECADCFLQFCLERKAHV